MDAGKDKDNLTKSYGNNIEIIDILVNILLCKKHWIHLF